MNAFKKIIYERIIPLIGYIFGYKNKYINVIYYHDIVRDEGYSFMKTNIDVFQKQMRYIAAKGYQTVRFDDIKCEQDFIYDPKKIIIAFDDGWLSNYTEIYDFMSHLGLRYNIFLSTGKIDNDPQYLTWDIIRKMHNSGLVGFGAHTYTHPDMTDISRINPDLEFNHADAVFKRELGFYPVDFCYPFGKYSEESNEYIINNQMYSRIYTSRMMYTYKQKGKYIFGRSGISNDDSMVAFKAKLKGHFNIWGILVR